MAKTIRQRIVEALYAILPTITDPDDNTKIVFNNVLRDNLDGVDVDQLPAVGVDEGEEEVVDYINPFVGKKLRVYVEFRFENDGVDVYERFNYYLGVLQNALLDNHNLAGLSYDVQEVGNSPRIADRDDTLPGGVLMIDIYYRHLNGNPFTR